jgi:hypothetical protein
MCQCLEIVEIVPQINLESLIYICEHTLEYFFTNDSMKQCLELVRNVPQIILKCLIYLCVLTH